MTTQISTDQAQTWVPVTDETFESLYQEYCTWLTLPPEDRAHLAALRRWESECDALAVQNPPEHRAWRSAVDAKDALYDSPGFDAAVTKCIEAYDAWKRILPIKPDVIYSPEKFARIESLKKRIAALEATSDEWQRFEKFTREESQLWCAMIGGMRFRSIYIDNTESIVAYFEAKLRRLYSQYVAARRESLGLGLKRGLKLVGRKGYRK